LADVSPIEVLRQVSQEIPRECHDNIIVVGSLAAAYQLLAPDAPITVRTKDLDCILSPRIQAIKAAKTVAEELIAHGWQQDKSVFKGKPGNALTPTDELPIVRLYPPGNLEWFIELLTVPESENQVGKDLERIEISSGPDPGYYGLPSFRFLSLAAYSPATTPFGIHCARPEMMALAHMLEHPEIKPERMTGLIEGRSIKRSNKDLGRVLAIARLSPDEERQTWAAKWLDGLTHCFPTVWRELAESAGSGLEQLLDSPEDLEEAHHTCVWGLLSSHRPLRDLLEELIIAGRRLIDDAVRPLRIRAQEGSE
jgi:hypothetical protein